MIIPFTFTHDILCLGENTRVETPNNINVEGEQYAAASTSASSTTASTVAVQAGQITSFFHPSKLLLTKRLPLRLLLLVLT